MAGARGCVSVIFPKLLRGSDAETECVCDPQPVRSGQTNSSRNLRGGILGEAATSATGRGFAACKRQRGADLSADRGNQRGAAERGAETAHCRECCGGI